MTTTAHAPKSTAHKSAPRPKLEQMIRHLEKRGWVKARAHLLLSRSGIYRDVPERCQLLADPA